MPDRSSFTMHTAVNGTGVVVTLGGDLDLTNAAALGRALAGLGETPPARLVLDMAGVDCLDCAAARVIAAAVQSLPGPRPVVIRDPSPIVRRLLEVSGLAADLRLEQTTPDRRPGDGTRPPPPDGQQTDPNCYQAGRLSADDPPVEDQPGGPPGSDHRSGGIDIASTGGLNQAVAAALQGGATEVIVDATSAGRCGLAGIAALARARPDAESAGSTLQIVAGPAVRQAITSTRAARPYPAAPPPSPWPPPPHDREYPLMTAEPGGFPSTVRADGRSYRYGAKDCHYRCWDRGADGRCGLGA